MTARLLFRELGYPLTNAVVLSAIVTFSLLVIVTVWLLAMLSRASGMLGVLLGVFLGIMLLPALFRYLLMLLEARAYGRTPPVASLELFSFVENFWTLAPLVIIALSIWGGYWLDRNVSPWVAQAFSVLLLAITPASLAVLAITQSAAQALNPAAVSRMFRVLGWSYSVVPALVAVVFFLASRLADAGAPTLVRTAIVLYGAVLAFTLTGALLHANGVKISLSVEGVAEGVGDEEDKDPQTHARSQVLNHAYGFFSRDNRAGALAHIRSALRDETDADTAYYWYFTEMLKWESKDAALMLAQTRLTELLREERGVEAVKLISRCLLENPRFRPLPGDLDAALQVAARLDRDDLVRTLESTLES